MENKEVYKTFFVLLLVVLTAMALGIFAYTTFIKKDNTADTNDKPNELVEVSEKTKLDIINFITDFPAGMPITLNDSDPVGYTASELTGSLNSNIIFSYAYQLAKYDGNSSCADEVCYVKVTDLYDKYGLNIGNNFTKNDYVSEIVTRDNGEYYKVLTPSMGWDQNYSAKDCKATSADNKLTVACDIIKVIEPYEPYIEEKIGNGKFIYDVKDKLTFEKFVFDANN